MKDDLGPAQFFDRAAREVCGLPLTAGTPVLDFGCGRGELVRAFTGLGYDARGCDVLDDFEPQEAAPRLAAIQLEPYRLPFDDASFDLVVSKSVLEHAQNKETCFREIHRVLRPGGWALHLFPAKWYLPYEPHIHVPLANALWPHVPGWWLSLWALLGVRNEYQSGKGWREVAALNREYCRTGLSYWGNAEYARLAQKVFGNHRELGRFAIEHGAGGVARLLSRLPLREISGRVASHLRMHFIAHQKTG